MPVEYTVGFKSILPDLDPNSLKIADQDLNIFCEVGPGYIGGHMVWSCEDAGLGVDCLKITGFLSSDMNAPPFKELKPMDRKELNINRRQSKLLPNFSGV